MGHDEVGGFTLIDKEVLDWNQHPLGRVADIGRDPKTNAARDIVVDLAPEARDEMSSPEDLLTVPMSFVFGIRRDSVTLDRSLEELRRIGESARSEAEAPERPVTEILKH